MAPRFVSWKKVGAGLPKAFGFVQKTRMRREPTRCCWTYEIVTGLTRKYAAEVLGELKDVRAVQPLVDALADEVGDVRQRAYDSLIKIGGPAVSVLVPLLVSEEDEIRQSVTEIIRKIGKPAVEPLATALAEADDRLKTRVMKVLDRMGYKPKVKEEAKEAEAPRLT
ncbi:MAG: HEAT repeat domain-containing protein [Nitrospira sp.]|nr:MAG: HEAT repeat domain-containing protein [Nitrospira sp.]